MAKKNIKYPFTDSWELLHWTNRDFGETAGGIFYKGNIHWYENYTFGASLHFVGVTRGRSAVTFIWEDSKGRQYPMFIIDIGNLLLEGKIEKGWTGLQEWTFCKRGSNYGIKLVEKNNAEN